MNGLLIGAVMAVGMFQQTDTTFAVGRAEALHVETLGGSIEISVWDRDEVRIQAEHSSRTYIEVSRSRNHIDVEAEARRGPANLVDFRITVPRTFGLDLEANQGDITMDGVDGQVSAETVRGDIYLRGGRGSVEVSNTVGNILIEGAEGRIEIESSAADVRVVDSGGEIFAETAGGTIVLQNVTASAVDVGSTGGRVHFDGRLDPAGTYFFGSHGGSVTIVVPEDARASFNLATIHGSISSNLGGQNQSYKSGERHSFDVGGGGALVEAETYGGRIRIVRSGSEGAQAPAARRRDVRDDVVYAPMADAWSEVMGGDFVSDMAGDLAADLAEDLTSDLGHDLSIELSHDLSMDLSHEVSGAWAPQVARRVRPVVNAAIAPAISIAIDAAMSATRVPLAPREPASEERRERGPVIRR